MVPLTLNILISIYVDEKQLILSNLGRIQDDRCKILLTRGCHPVQWCDGATVVLIVLVITCPGWCASCLPPCYHVMLSALSCATFCHVRVRPLSCADPSYRVNRIILSHFSTTICFQNYSNKSEESSSTIGCFYKLSTINLVWGPLKCTISNFNPVHVFLHFKSFCLVVLQLILASKLTPSCRELIFPI